MSQKEQIKSFLEAGRTITPMIAFEKFGCLRLSERIREIENDGLIIFREWKKVKGTKTQVMSYRAI